MKIGLPGNHIITVTSKGKLGGGQNERIELPGAVETDGLGTIKKPRRAEQEMKDRFEAGENPCDRCKWWSARPTDFPCYRCTHNNALEENKRDKAKQE